MSTPIVDRDATTGRAVPGPRAAASGPLGTPGLSVSVRPAARARFRDVLAVREFRALLAADLLSLLGDQLAAVAVGYLLYQRTGSPFLAAAGYAVTWLPALLGGPVLAALADRWPSRPVLVGTDLGRAGLVALAALPGLPPAAVAGLVLGAAMLGPPHETTRSAVQLQVLPGPRYAIGSALRNTAHQASLLFGLTLGGAVVLLVGPSGALLLDAGTFLASAALLRFGLAARPGPSSADRGCGDPRPNVRADLLAGYRVVVSSPALAWPLTLGAVAAGAGVVPEALAPAYAAGLTAADPGSWLPGGRLPAEPVLVGLLMAAGAAGNVLGGLLLPRFAPDGGRRLVWPLAVAGMLPLVAVAAGPGLGLTLLLLALAGAAGAFQVTAQAMFAAAAPEPLRGRVFGLAMAVIAGVQALAAALAGALAELVEPPLVIAAAGVAGGVFLLCLRPLSPESGVRRAAGPPIRRRSGLPLPAARHRA